MGKTCHYCGSSEIEEDSAMGNATCTNCGAVLEESTITSEITFEERGGGGGQVVGTWIKQGQGIESVPGMPGVIRTESREQTFYKGKKLIQEVNIYDLGRTLNFLTRSLSLKLPNTDPCWYVLRFAVLLDLGDKLKDVVDLATRIVNRMKRDWLSTGRRPTGLCGAALLLAARAHNYNRSIADIVRVVHISESVVRKRLDEFAATPSGSLTIEDFNNVDLEHNEDPPAYQESKRRAKEVQETCQLDEMTKQLEPMQKEIEDELKKRMKSHPFAKMIVDINDEDVPELSNAAEIIRGEFMESVYDDMNEPSTSTSIPASLKPTLQSLGITPGMYQPQLTVVNSWNIERDDGELDLTGIDDGEIEGYLLTDKESQLKERMWMARNQHHLAEMERRRKLREDEEQRERENPKKRRKTYRKKDDVHAASHSEAMVQVIHEKKLSNKINYDILCNDDFGILMGVEKKADDTALDKIPLKHKSEIQFSESRLTEVSMSDIVVESVRIAESRTLEESLVTENSHAKNGQDHVEEPMPSIQLSLKNDEQRLPIKDTGFITQPTVDPNKSASTVTQPTRRIHIKARPNLKAGRTK